MSEYSTLPRVQYHVIDIFTLYILLMASTTLQYPFWIVKSDSSLSPNKALYPGVQCHVIDIFYIIYPIDGLAQHCSIHSEELSPTQV